MSTHANETDELTVFDGLIDTAREHLPSFAEQGQREKAADFLRRLVSVLGEIPDETYDCLTDAERAWLDPAVLAFNAQEDIAFPDGFVDAFVPVKAARPTLVAPPAALARTRPVLARPEPPGVLVHEPTGDVDDAPPEPAQPIRRVAAVPATAPAAAPPAAPRRGRPPGSRNGTTARAPAEHVSRGPRSVKEGFTVRTVRRMIIENPDITVDELEKAAQAAGGDPLKRSTLVQQQMTTKNVIAIYEEVHGIPAG